MPPTPTNGKICYIEIPATDAAASAKFYANAFGWKVRTRGDGDASLTHFGPTVVLCRRREIDLLGVAWRPVGQLEGGLELCDRSEFQSR